MKDEAKRHCRGRVGAGWPVMWEVWRATTGYLPEPERAESWEDVGTCLA